jgi:lipid II:glycine glycyltransferase (peptidoglycan interpeptide bridge formation enzyme)
LSLTVREWKDPATWDDFIASQQSCHFQQGWAWGELARPLGGDILRFGFLDGSNLVAAMSVAANPIRKTARQQLSVWRGPVVDAPNPEVIAVMSNCLSDVARDLNAVSSRVEPHVEAGDRRWTSLLHDAGYSPIYPPSQPRSTWVLDLTPPESDLLSAMKPKTRYNIRLAEKKGVDVTAGGPDDVDAFYEMYQETALRDQFYIHPKEIYRDVFGFYWEQNQFELLIARYEGVPIAAVTLVHLGKYVWYLYGASTNRHREVMAPHLLQWKAIQWAKQRGAQIYDFRGIPDVPARGQEMYGVSRFKQGFGGRQITYLETYSRGHQRPAYELWKLYWGGRFFAESARRRAKGLPQKGWA